jgi:hypothetical protein
MKWLRDNALTLTLVAFFAFSVIGQAWAGWLSERREAAEHAMAAPALLHYLGSGAFLSALFENWESEFLQMSAFVILTAYLVQRGSPESKDPDKPAPQDSDPARDADKPGAPWPVRAGPLARLLYSHSLGLALFALFVTSFVLHWINSARHAAEQAMAHHQPPAGVWARLTEADFWFESFQNWQSEFLSTAVLIVLGIFLRERRSPESKPVAAPHLETGAQ